MTSSDLDPSFVKALKLLLSRGKESIEQLKQMVDEALEQRKKEIANKITLGSGDEFIGKSSISKKEQLEMTKKREREVEKASLEKLKQDIANLTEENPAKKPRVELGSSPVVSAAASPRSTDGKEKEKDRGTKTKTDSKEKPRERLREIEEDIFFGVPSSSTSNKQKDADKNEKEERQKDKMKEPHDPKEEKGMQSFEPDSGSETEVSGDELQMKDALEEMQFELELGNLSCVVCKAFGVTSTNRLIECQECHSLYHQECHKPAVTDNVNDPRFVWYCSKCTKNLKKIVTKNTNKKTKTPLPLNARESPVGRIGSKNDSAQIQQPFKRLEQPIKSSTSKDNGNTSGASGNGRGLSGLASLAANLSKSSSSLEASKMPKSDSASRLAQLSASSHSAFTARTDAGKTSQVDASLKSGGSKDVPLKSSHLVKTESGKPSSAFGTGGQSKAPTGKTPPASSVTSSGSTTKMSQSSLMSADKRLQMMKKQAAKMAEKRSLK